MQTAASVRFGGYRGVATGNFSVPLNKRGSCCGMKSMLAAFGMIAAVPIGLRRYGITDSQKW